MKAKLVILLFGLVFISCNSEKKEVQKEAKKDTKEALIMYVPSEMTVLMREMYTFQEKSKKQIIKGELPLDFPDKFMKIHTSKLSDDFEHDASFKGFTNMYYQNIKNLKNSTKDNAKQNFNTAIQTCIACHETTCTGPIPRIKKLLIK